MKYVGSKRRIVKHILPIMLAERKPDQWWVEPFVGGANMISVVGGPRLGNDTNEYLVALLIAVRDGYVPPAEVSREMYQSIKANPCGYPKELVGFVGFLCSFNSKWWGGYAKNTATRRWAEEGSRGVVKQSKGLQGVLFTHGSYLDLSIPENSIIYCDPPYKGTCGYRDEIEYGVFWDWVRSKSNGGHTVFVSEYSAPEDFICIKEIHIRASLNPGIKPPRVERLFKYRRAE